VRLVDLTALEFYDAYAEAWRCEFDGAWPSAEVGAAQDARRSPSRARVAGDGEVVCAAVADFGPHAAGVRLCEVREATDLCGAVLFFYRAVQSFDAGDFAIEARTLCEAQRARLRLDVERRRAEREAEEQRQVLAAVAFFERHAASRPLC
jgi:hypothetical protein